MVSDKMLLEVSSNLLYEEIERLLKVDWLLSDGRVSVNLTTEGKITTCWARRPTRRDRRRYRRLLNRARRKALSRGEVAGGSGVETEQLEPNPGLRGVDQLE
jgi:hypothetical protein